MLKMITASYKSFFKNFPLILLYSVPLLALSILEVYFEQSTSTAHGIFYFIAFSVYLLPLVSAATDIAVYRRLFKFAKLNPFSDLRAMFFYLFTQIILGLIATLPIFIFKVIFSHFALGGLTTQVISVFLNLFLGIWFLARFNIILPLLVRGEIPTLKTFLAYSKRSYGQWLSVAFLIYLPYIIINYTVACPYTSMILTTLMMFLFVCFNAEFVIKNKWTGRHIAHPEKMAPYYDDQPHSSAKPALKKETTAKAPAAKKAAPAKAKTTELKKPSVKKPAAPKKAPATKKSAPAKKAPEPKASAPKPLKA